MRALVLGGGGFIGSHLVDELVLRHDEVRVLDRTLERHRQTPPVVDYRLGDYGDVAALAEALQDVDVVFHLASETVPSTSNLDPEADIAVNLIPTVRLLEQMVKIGVPRIVFLSSGGTVYGNTGSAAVPVGHPLQPLCSYGIVKVAIEHYVRMFHQLHGLSAVILRASNPYGPRQGHLGVQGAIATFLDRTLREQPIHVWGDGHHVRDYIYISDLARLCVLAGDSGLEGTYNAGGGVGHSVNQVLRVIADTTGRQPDVRYGPARALDVDGIVLDVTDTEAHFDWSPTVDLDEGVALHWEWVQRCSIRLPDAAAAGPAHTGS